MHQIKDKTAQNALNKSKVANIGLQSYGLLIFCAFISALMSFLLYKETQNILEERLKERLIGVVSTASLIFDVEELDSISGPDSVGTNAYTNAVLALQGIRLKNSDIHYAYLLRPTSDLNTYTYVADADSLEPFEEIDLNEDGIINEEDALVAPGDEYDVSEIPALRNIARNIPATDADPVSDQWGSFLSAYAPIIDNDETVAILGIDVEVTNYLRLIRKTIIPFSAFVIFLLCMLTLMTFALVRVWNQQVSLLKELDHQKDELLSIVSHQLATPVSSIKWYLEMLMDGDLGKLTQKQKEHVGAMQSISINLADLVSMILDVSRIQLGRVNIEKQELDLQNFFSEILQIIEPKAKEKHVNFEKNIQENLPQALLDKRYTHMTIENLLSNAIKYTSEGGLVSLKVFLKNGTLHCSIKDNGVGIPKNEQSKIFGRMFRASNVRNSVDGNGFGLYIAKGAIEAQGGKIYFESEEGKGTTFYIEIPII